MAATSSIGSFLDEFKIDLDARSGLDGVRVFTAPVDEIVEGDEAIILGHESIAGEWTRATMTCIGERFTVPCRIISFKPGATNIASTGHATEASTTAARLRALAILEEVYDAAESDHHGSSTVQDINITGVTIEQAPYEQGSTPGRICSIGFTLTVDAMFDPA